nr:hypothetical protein [Nostoc sp. ChiQUE02]MDZ8234805.1 hypothetical protein [Nostoc sp. ChiQUE02]
MIAFNAFYIGVKHWRLKVLILIVFGNLSKKMSAEVSYLGMFLTFLPSPAIAHTVVKLR